MILTRRRLASMMDYALVKPTHSLTDVEEAAKAARENNIGVLCVLPVMVEDAVKLLKGSETKVCSTVGFPFGSSTTKLKVLEAEQVIDDGACEVDMVMNIPFFKSKLYEKVKSDVEAVLKVSKPRDVKVKVIVETGYLTAEEIALACKIIDEAGADYVKTCTGFGPRGTTIEDIEIIKKNIKRAKIKAAGGISSFEKALQFIKMGVERIGTSNALEILRSWRPVEV
ncbi:deoxyribose-phosphate aldolase [Candidatus Bathyarchaeota archaeon]|nr:deoxyribose-phosphate aldolase [Candidatus Bathyarchaeota archaeon]MBS7618164.1 deoxyribose-phosphate aldolase [Candidatus Bathyarchaeota archaeon]